MSDQNRSSDQGRLLTSSSSAHAALLGIYEISKVLTRPARLEEALSGVMRLLASFLDMHDGLIALIGEDDETTTVVGSGWSEGTAREQFERLPEQAVGQIVVSGMPLMVRNIAESPLFADWSELKSGEPGIIRAFVGVPIRNGDRTIGTIMIERQSRHDLSVSLDEDARFLTMVANLVGQTVALQTLVARDRERLMNERHRYEEILDPCAKRTPAHVSGIVGDSESIRSVIEKIQQVARCNLPVLLCGESGTGKELFARAIHEYSPRKNKPCIKVNCAALSESVLESELFGHEKGAFTGAVEMRKGRFELANGGTLFLDEIGEISTSFQAKLLRVLQEGEFERVGGSRTIKVDVRLVTATNRNLEEAVLNRSFRSDLYYRIGVVPVYLPPLRERREDVPLLAAEFLKRFNKEHGVALVFSQSAMRMLTSCDFPGNVRELESCVRRTAALANNSTISVEDFACNNGSCLSLMLGRSLNARTAAGMPWSSGKGATSVEAETALPVIMPAQPAFPRGSGPAPADTGFGERQRLVEAMERSGWVQAKAARILGLTPRQMGYALRKYGIEIKKF
jgi:Nif-specific regulatory protein